MTEKITYVAIDGREFEDEQECIDYEKSLKLNNLCRSTTFLDEEFQIMDIKTLDPQQVYYIYVNNDDDKKFINDFFTENWSSSPFSTGYGQYTNLSEYSGWFYFDTNQDEWKHFETEIQIYKDMENNFSKIMLDKGLKM